MKFSAQEEYGLRCILQIARRGPDRSATILEIGNDEGLTPTHVAKLLAQLRRCKLVVATRGQAGGYTLARPANQILVSEVLDALGGKLYDQAFCTRHAGKLSTCAHNTDCSVRSLWQRLQIAVDIALRDMNVDDLIGGGQGAQVVFHGAPRRTGDA